MGVVTLKRLHKKAGVFSLREHTFFVAFVVILPEHAVRRFVENIFAGRKYFHKASVASRRIP